MNTRTGMARSLIIAVSLTAMAPRISANAQQPQAGSSSGRTGAASSLGSAPKNLTNVRGILFFSADDGIHGRELWKTDGTAVGTVLVEDIAPGSAGSGPESLTEVGGALFFSANDRTHGRELWTSDGTDLGTVLVRDIVQGPRGSRPQEIVAKSGRAFFSANGLAHGRELWRSDGTSLGTLLVKDINPSGDSNLGWPYHVPTLPYQFTNVAGTLFFEANDGSHGQQPWQSDGTAKGTVRVNPAIDFTDAGGAYPTPGPFTAVGDKAFFGWQSDGSQGSDLWVSDGTPAGTKALPAESVYSLTDVGGVCFFGSFANPGVIGRSDGTVAGTFTVKAPSPNIKAHISSLTQVSGNLFFVAGDGSGGITGRELWVSDGTESGTVVVKDISPAGQSQPSYLTDVHGELFLQATTRRGGTELWRSNGTDAGTTQVADITAGAGSSNPADLTAVGTAVFFAADDGVYGTELWKSDGTSAGTVLVADIS